jgi:ABC-type proline/glycine betaine transport system permease subunit
MPRSNPYRKAWAVARRNKGVGHWLRAVLRFTLPIAAVGLGLPWFRPVITGLVSSGVYGFGVEAITFRLAALVACAMSLHTYADLVRGPDRAVLDVHPVLPRVLLRALAWRTGVQRAYLPLMGAVALLPLGMEGHWDAWLGATGVVLGAWICALGVGFTVHLAGVWAALSPSLAQLLDALRGDNPRMQAALIYAPGVVLVVVGGASALAFRLA